MKRVLSLIEISFVVVLLIVVILTSYYSKDFIAIASIFLFCFFGIPSIMDGIHRFNNTEEGKNRSVAMILSLIPGAGHAYLNCWRRSIYFSLITIAFFVLLATFVCDHEELKKYSPLGMLFFIVFGWFASSLDVQRLADSIGLRYDGTQFEMRIKNYDLFDRILMVIGISVWSICNLIYYLDLADGSYTILPVMCTVIELAFLSYYMTMRYKDKRCKDEER